jgi:hypothetical protein
LPTHGSGGIQELFCAAESTVLCNEDRGIHYYIRGADGENIFCQLRRRYANEIDRLILGLPILTNVKLSTFLPKRPSSLFRVKKAYSPFATVPRLAVIRSALLRFRHSQDTGLLITPRRPKRDCPKPFQGISSSLRTTAQDSLATVEECRRKPRPQSIIRYTECGRDRPRQL